MLVLKIPRLFAVIFLQTLPLKISRQMRNLREKKCLIMRFLRFFKVLRIFFSQTMHLMENHRGNFFLKKCQKIAWKFFKPTYNAS